MFSSAVISPMVAVGAEDQPFPDSDEDVPFSTARIFSKLTEELGLNPNADWFETFGETDPKKVGKDLYMVIYKKTKSQPQKQATKNVANKYGLPQSDLIHITNADYGPIIDKKPGLTQEELTEKITEIQNELNAERELLELKANIKASTEMSEIFANGDLGDSGFDLIHDLDRIEEILFLRASPIEIGRSYTKAGAGGAGGNAPVGQAGGTQATVTGPEGTKLPSIPTTPQSNYDPITNTPVKTGQGGQQVKSGDYSGQVNPLECFDDNDYEEALGEFETKSLTNTNYKDGSGGQTPYSGEIEFGAPKTSGSTPGSATGSGSEPVLEAKPAAVTNTKAAESDDWSKKRWCNDDKTFCLEIRLVRKPAVSAFANADNCIACHIQKINDVLKTTITHSLVPAKATGNLGESAMCKKGVINVFGTVSMNVYAIAQPVQTPLNDDLVYGTTIAEDWKRYCETAIFPFGMCDEPPKTVVESKYEIPPLVGETAAQKILNELPDEAPLQEASKRIDEYIVGVYTQQQKEISELDSQGVTAQKIMLFQALQPEMDQMNYYFANIRDLMQSLHTPVDGIPGGQACTRINNTGECK